MASVAEQRYFSEYQQVEKVGIDKIISSFKKSLFYYYWGGGVGLHHS